MQKFLNDEQFKSRRSRIGPSPSILFWGQENSVCNNLTVWEGNMFYGPFCPAEFERGGQWANCILWPFPMVLKTHGDILGSSFHIDTFSERGTK